MKIVYRPATPADAPTLAKLSMLASGGTFDLLLKGMKRGVKVEDVLTTFCAGEDTEYSYKYFMVAEADGKIAGAINALTVQQRYDLAPNINPNLQSRFGFGVIQLIKFYFRARHLKGMNILRVPSRNSMHVNDIAVFPEYNGQGIGKGLMQVTIEKAKQEKRDYVSLYVWADNTHAIEFYTKLGFKLEKTADVIPHKYLQHHQSHLMLLKI